MKKKDYRNTIIIILAIINLGLLGYILYKNISGNNLKQMELQANFEELKQEYNDMKADLESKTDEMQSQSGELMQSKMQLEAIFSKQKITEEDLAKAEELMKAISDAVFKKYKDRVVVLEGEKVELMSAKQLTESKNKNLSMRIIGLEKTNKQIENSLKKEIKQSTQKDKLLEYASKLSTDKFVIKAFKVRNSGKEVETDKASKIDRVKIYFDVRENKVAKSGPETIYIIFTSENGDLVNIKDKATGAVQIDGRGRTYNDKIDIEYNNEMSNPVELIYDSDDFSRGVYQITLVNNGQIIGQQLLELR